MEFYKVVALALILVIGLTVCLSGAAEAQNLIVDALKIFGIGYVVTVFGGQINDFINNLANQKGINWEGTTKVVPIISVGAGTYVGAAQVVGPPDRVDTVQAVGQVEARISGIRGRYLIPISTKTPGSTLSRIQGVGISGLIDFRI
jgi:hypothetical protein